MVNTMMQIIYIVEEGCAKKFHLKTIFCIIVS